jgi:hypothetical protein
MVERCDGIFADTPYAGANLSDAAEAIRINSICTASS